MNSNEESATRTLRAIRDNGLGGVAADTCDYCDELKIDCRPVCVENRQYVPALCSECFEAIAEAGRIDSRREREVFYPDA